MCVFHTGRLSFHIQVSAHVIHDRIKVLFCTVALDAPLIAATLEQVVIILNEIQLNESGVKTCNTHRRHTSVFLPLRDVASLEVLGC